MDLKKKFDIAILGAGPGGYVAAITAAQKGKKVCLIEQNEVGGTCLNVGCIPTKYLLAAAKMVDKIPKFSDFGVNIQLNSIDFTKIQKRKDEIIFNLRASLEKLIKAHKIEIISGEASFTSPYQLIIKEKNPSLIQADTFIIATGSEPLEISKFPFDNEFIHNSTSILSLKQLPQNIAIIGGGYIGCEFASFFNSFNVKVTVIEASSSILSSLDKDLSDSLTQIFLKKGIEILPLTSLINIEKEKDHLLLNLSGEKRLKTDICLIAAGRKPRIDKINLKAAGISVDQKGKIIVNDKMQTNIKHIYAIGDITGKFMLAHVASHQGIVAVNNALGIDQRMRYEAIPSVIFTLPEVATVGLSAKEAKNQGFDIICSTFPLRFLSQAQAYGELEGFASIVIDKNSRQLIGAHIIGAEASTMIAEMALAINNELTLESLIETIHAHPTYPEAWLEAGFIADGSPIHYLTKR